MQVEEQTVVQEPMPTDIIKPARKAYSRSQLNLALFYLFYIIISLIILQFMPEDFSETVAYLVNYIPMYLIAFPLYLFISKPLETTKPEPHSMSFPQLLIAFLICEFIGIFGNFIGMIVNVILTLLSGTQTASTVLTDGVFGESSLLFLFLAVVCAPFVEEMLFRKILIDRTRKYSDTTAILISGIMFGLFHGNFTQFFYAAMLGMMFAFIYVRTGKIQYTIGLHMAINFWGTAMPYLTLRNVDLNSLTETLTSMNVSQLFSALTDLKYLLIFTGITYSIAIAGMIMLIIHRKKLKVNPPIAPVPKGKRFVTACCNLGCLAMLIVCGVRFLQQLGII